METNKYQKCDCGKKAVWVYMPGYSGNANPYHCDTVLSTQTIKLVAHVIGATVRNKRDYQLTYLRVLKVWTGLGLNIQVTNIWMRLKRKRVSGLISMKGADHILVANMITMKRVLIFLMNFWICFLIFLKKFPWIGPKVT